MKTQGSHWNIAIALPIETKICWGGWKLWYAAELLGAKEQSTALERVFHLLPSTVDGLVVKNIASWLEPHAESWVQVPPILSQQILRSYQLIMSPTGGGGPF